MWYNTKVIGSNVREVNKLSNNAQALKNKKTAEIKYPEYVPSKVRCACGAEFETMSTKPELIVDICAKCHPFFTGKQKFVDSGGRVEKFNQRFMKSKSSKE